MILLKPKLCVQKQQMNPTLHVHICLSWLWQKPWLTSSSASTYIPNAKAQVIWDTWIMLNHGKCFDSPSYFSGTTWQIITKGKMVFITPMLDKNGHSNCILRTAPESRTYQIGAKSEDPKGKVRTMWNSAIYSVQSVLSTVTQLSACGTNIWWHQILLFSPTVFHIYPSFK